MFKVRKWELMLIRLIALPILEKLVKMVEQKAIDDVEENFLDILANALRVVIEFLKQPSTFLET